MEYKTLTDVYEKLESTPKRLEKTHILALFLRNSDHLDEVMLLVQGRVFPIWDEREIGMASRLLLKAIATSTGASQEKIEGEWKKIGDLGEVASKLVGKKSQHTLFSDKLTVQKVFSNLQKLASLEGSGTVERKVQLVAELLTSASPKEAKYIIRTILGELRVGLGEGTIRDAIVWAFFDKRAKISYDGKENDLLVDDRALYQKYVDLVQEAYDVAADFAVVVKAAKRGEKALQDISLVPLQPVKVMLFQKANDIREALGACGSPAAIEYKYDGFRLQIHKSRGKVKLFTRRLEDVTRQFPDVIAALNHVQGKEYIIDAEVVGIDKKTKKYLPFQNISQRIKRKYDIEEMAQKYPVEVNIFDILFNNGESLLKTPFEKRRKILEGMVSCIPQRLKLAEQIITGDESEAEKFYKESLDFGNEGVMVKNLKESYKPGSRVGFGMKVKPTMDTLEVVIVGAEWGEGKRGKWLSSFIVAVRDEESGEFVEIGRVGTGIKEKAEEGMSFGELTKILEPIITEEKGREVRVKPKIVMEVNYEEIQKSPTYSSGFALRFPRMVKLREDRSPRDSNTLEDVKKLYGGQRGRKA